MMEETDHADEGGKSTLLSLKAWKNAAFQVLVFIAVGVGISLGMRIVDDVLEPRISAIHIDNYICEGSDRSHESKDSAQGKAEGETKR